MALIDDYILNGIRREITEVVATMKQKTIEQGKSMFAIRDNPPTIDSMDYRQVTFSTVYDTMVLDSELEAEILSDNGWMVFKVEEE